MFFVSIVGISDVRAIDTRFTPQVTDVLIGDSIDSFVGDGVYTEITSSIIERELNIAIRNISVSGATLGRTPAEAANGLNSTRTTDTLTLICPSYCGGLIITAGSNDFNAPDITWKEDNESLGRIFNWAIANNKKVIMMDIIWRTSNDDNHINQMGLTINEYRLYRAYTCIQRPTVCTYFPRPAEFNVSNPSLYYSIEQANGNLTHLNAAGHRIRATWIENAIISATAAGKFN